MFETMVSFVMVEHLHGLGFDPPQGGAGYSRVLAPWRRPYRTADGYLCMLAYTDAQWRRFWAEVGQPEMMQDPRFVDMAARSRNIDEVYRLAGERAHRAGPPPNGSRRSTGWKSRPVRSRRSTR